MFLNLFFNKVANLPFNFIKTETPTQVFSCEVAKFLRIPLMQNIFNTNRLILNILLVNSDYLAQSQHKVSSSTLITKMNFKILNFQYKTVISLTRPYYYSFSPI